MKGLLVGILIVQFLLVPTLVRADDDSDIRYTEFYLLNEVMVNPAGNDKEGEWVELYNAEPLAVDISHWYLDDAEGASRPYRFPANTIIPKGGYLLVSAPDLNLSFKNSEDEVRLLAPNNQIIQTVHYSGAKEEFSYAKLNTGWQWVSQVTPGADNQSRDFAKVYSGGDVEIVSVFPNPDGNDKGNEWLRLRNRLDEPVDLSSWQLWNKKDKVYSLSGQIDELSSVVVNPADLGLTLTNSYEHLKLIDGTGNVIHEMEWEDAPSGKALFSDDFLYDEIEAVVTKVIDGDTFEATIEDLPVTVRLIGIDTPETVHPFKAPEQFGYTASDYLKNRLDGQTVTLSFEPDKTDAYNRLLAYVYIGEDFINAELVQRGIGRAYTRFDFAYLNEFVDYESEAKSEGLGLWFSDASNPADFTEEEIIDSEFEAVQTVELDDEELVACPTEGLVIESILPNAEKGVSTEYIRITNPTNQRVCLSGWQLDDQIDKGSKPFVIQGGALVPGAVRTFRKSETGLSLNNSNDCANLINPLGELVDHVCYAKTHKNEVFTHAGGNWKPITTTLKKATEKQLVKPPRLQRSVTHFQSELTERRVMGTVDYVNKTLGMMVINDQQIRYDSEQFDLKLFEGKFASLQLRGDYLISLVIEENLNFSDQLTVWPVEFNYFIGLGLSITGMLGWRRKYLV